MTTPPPFSPFVYNRAVRDSELPAIARHVAMVLVTYANRAGEAWPTQATLEDGTGWARRSVNTALNDLEAGGWLTRLVKGHRGRATLYRLHLPGSSSSGSSPSPGAAVPSQVGLGDGHDEHETDSEHTLLEDGSAARLAGSLCTSGPDDVHLTPTADDVSCTPTPSGEQHQTTPSGSVLAQPEGVPDDLWKAATPLLDVLLAGMPQTHADRFTATWPLDKARDFCWQLTTLTGCHPRARGSRDAQWSPEALVGALLAVSLDDVTHVDRVLYRRLLRLADGVAAVPPAEDQRGLRREPWALPPGPVGDLLAGVAQQLAVPPSLRSG